MSTALFGIIFCGPPGKFSTWIVTPDGKLMTRETVELLGLLAVHAGAADYRVFPLDDADLRRAVDLSISAHGTQCCVGVEDFAPFGEMLRPVDGIPASSPAD